MSVTSAYFSCAIFLLVVWSSSNLSTSKVEAASGAQEFDEKFEHWPIKLKINGRIIVDNGIREIDGIQRLLDRNVKDRRVAFFSDVSLEGGFLEDALRSSVLESGEFNVNNVSVFPEESLRAALAILEVVVLNLGGQSLSSIEPLRALKAEFEAFIDKGGTLILNAATAEFFGAYFIPHSHDGQSTEAKPGLDLLPDCVLECEFKGIENARHEVLSVLARHPGSVGIGLAPETMLVLSGRRMSCFGKGGATFMLMADEHRPLRVESIVPRTQARRAEDSVVDLTEWRRDALDRMIGPFPPANPKEPNVENGALFIVGGGGLPRGLMTQFVEMAGGPKKARLVYVPCSEGDDVSERHRIVEGWEALGVQRPTVIHTKDRNKANEDEEFLAPLKDATGIWFGGGRQWNFSDSYYGTQAHHRMKEVLVRGGVIGGSSAGASIQARYLARATPIGNLRIIAPGYERGGLGFISGVAIDQHFSQRGRQKDMTQLVDRYPQLLGIGLDEVTAIVVRGSVAEVIGLGRAHFYDRNLPVYPGEDDFIALPSGSSYDLAKREVLVDTTESTLEADAEKDQAPAETAGRKLERDKSR